MQVGTDPAIRVHRAVLALRSPVFKALLESNMGEAAEGRATIAYSRRAVDVLIDYLYDDDPDYNDLHDLELTKEVVKMADYYQIEPLKYHYGDKLAKLIARGTLCELLVFADRIKSVMPHFSAITLLPCRLVHVLRAAVALLRANIDDVFKSDEWNSLDWDVRAKATQAAMSEQPYESING